VSFDNLCPAFFISTIDFILKPSSPPCHVYYDNLQCLPSLYSADHEYSYISTPYSADSFDILLEQMNLMHCTHDMRWDNNTDWSQEQNEDALT